MPATLNKINVHAMLKWVIQLIERVERSWRNVIYPFNKLVRSACNILNIVKSVAPCEITCKRFNPRPGYGGPIVTLTSKSVNEIL